MPRFLASPVALQVIDAILTAPKLYLTSHIAPDGDTMGSTLGLYWGLQQIGKQTRIACADPVPASFRFLPGHELFKAQLPEPDELIVIPDASDLQRLGSIYDAALYANRPLINIDHHVTNVSFGTLNWIEPAAASTAEIITELLDALGVQIDETIAACLLTGIATDTLGFRTNSTTADLMETAARLMRAGASLPRIIEKTFNTRDLADLKMQGQVLAAMRTEDGLIWSDNTVQMRRAAGASESGGAGMGNTLLSVQGVRVSVVFIEKNNRQVEVSFRARAGYDVSQLAFRLGGGGHPQAAGCLLSASLEQAHELVLPLTRALLNGHAAAHGV
ncbi:MAG: bifunctional oligoribonuclease/PAP phosphatase NrnA [Chloroflexi bacterium]|nr:bifunctional oligoribonuclease/PAP phosphatase NrnA [Chloroflexota bacterium]